MPITVSGCRTSAVSISPDSAETTVSRLSMLSSTLRASVVRETVGEASVPKQAHSTLSSKVRARAMITRYVSMRAVIATATSVCSGAEGTHSTSASATSATGNSVATERWKGRSGSRSEVIASSVPLRAPSFASPEVSSVRVSSTGAAISRLVMHTLLPPPIVADGMCAQAQALP